MGSINLERISKFELLIKPFQITLLITLLFPSVSSFLRCTQRLNDPVVPKSLLRNDAPVICIVRRKV